MKLPSLSFTAIGVAVFPCCLSSNLSDEYKKNPPVYCADPSNRCLYEKTRKIPPLGPTEADLEGLRLKQAQVTTRHGARALDKIRKCWSSFLFESSVQDCKSGEVAMGWIGDDDVSRVTIPIPKYFDASLHTNKLRGSSCELGQLLPKGHEQHRINGKLLANAYFKDPTATNNLFDLLGMLKANESLDNFIYFRSTDYERTRMSGVELLSSMVKTVHPSVNDPKIKLHTAQKEVDILRPNLNECYGLVEATTKAFSGEEYVNRFGKKHELAHSLVSDLMGIDSNPKAGKGSWPWDPFECLGVALCSGFDLPTEGNWTRENVDVIHAAAIEEFAWPFLSHDSHFSKIGSAPFAYDVKAFAVSQLCRFSPLGKETDCFRKLFDNESEEDDMKEYLNLDSNISPHPFVYRSLHETTIGPFIAAFGEKFWNDIAIDYIKKNSKFDGLRSPYPSYATLMVLEFYESKEDFLFRMIYNGQVITQHVPGCKKGKELCSVKTFFKAMAWATRDLALDPCKEPPMQTEHPMEESNSFVLAPSMFTILIGFALAQI